MIPRRLRSVCRGRLARGLVLAALLAAGCARREPPSGGPPDIEPPRVVSAQPDSGAAGVPVDARISLTFSEPMEPRTTADAVQFAPPVRIKEQRWSGRTLTLTLGEPLPSPRTITVFVGKTARDRHGNIMRVGATRTFSTGPVFPPGRIEGRVDARGFAPAGTFLWCYEASRTGVPDSTGRDFDALGLVDERGHFRVDGLAVPGRYRLWAFADLSANRSFEPDRDILAPADTVFELTAVAPAADSARLVIINPRAPGTVEGTVIDSVADSVTVTRVLAVAAWDSTLRALADLNREKRFELSLAPGWWTLRAFHDDNRDRDWQADHEAASDTLGVKVGPAGEVKDLKLSVRRPP